ncbi:MAG: chloride channel protein, CIC family [bacterium P3]|nr:MAG: chloride channel protein, CIC family [bacterium P201]KWW30460.1 MAG: chloride channel protein, CIC family [bacterium P3]KWW41347.1 MAG: chloride channel protein, CIC family [bacterium F083]
MSDNTPNSAPAHLYPALPDTMKAYLGDTLYKKLHVWRLRHLSDNSLLLLLSVAVGVLTGLAAVVLKTVVHVAGTALVRLSANTSHWLLLVYPLAGITLTLIFVRYVLVRPVGHGIPNVLLAISRHGGKLPARNMWGSMAASTLTVSFGGSVGLEAPIASTGSAIGSNVGRFFRLNPKQVRMLLGCGAAGAIAGIFKAPLAGILFVVEVLMFDLTKTSAIPLLLSSISATTIAYFLMGNDVQFAFQVVEPFELSQIPYYVVLGVFCALVSLYFLRTTDRVESWLSRQRNCWMRALAGGIGLGVLVYLFPPLYGEGYASLSALLSDDFDAINWTLPFIDNRMDTQFLLLAVLLALILLKAVATAVTIGSGGVGGTFGPSLVVGGVSGYFVATLNNQMGLPPQSTANFALVGMAAVMAGVMHAPLMATFLIAEITGGYALMAPLLICVAVTYLCVNPFEQHSIYARKLAAHGDLMTHDKDQSAWQLMDMRKLIETNFIIVRHGDTMRQLITAIEQSRRNIFPVLDDEDRFLGVIHLDDVRRIMFRPDLYDNHRVEELMHPLSEGDIVRLEDPLAEVVNKFRIDGSRYNLIVIDKDDNYIGFLSRANMFTAYRRFISESSDE